MVKFLYAIVISDKHLLDLTSYVRLAFPEQFSNGNPSFPIEGRKIQAEDNSKRNDLIGGFRILLEKKGTPASRFMLDGLAKKQIEITDPNFLASNYYYKWSVVEDQIGNKAWVIAVCEL
jgi:hypothetical protein